MESESHSQSPQSSTRHRKKTSNACIGCRNRKSRCSGRNPCEKCVGRKEPCVYEERERKAAVPVTYIDSLLARIKSLETQLEATGAPEIIVSELHQPSQDPQLLSGDICETRESTAEPASHPEPEDLINTLVASEPQIKVRRYGHATFLGHSSTLSFSRNVRNLLQNSTAVADPGSASVEREDASYATSLPSIVLDLATVPLPALQYAEYLTNTVLLRLGSLYRLFDPDTFFQRLRAFYGDISKRIFPEASLWHLQFLLVLAFGKSILSREHSDRGPSGMSYFTLVMEALPDIRRMYGDPFLSIEILCLASLFMHATDMLQESYVCIGQAVRVSVTKSLNRVFPEAMRPPNVQYQRELWWTVYSIDCKSAAMLGSSLVMRDEDISIPFPDITKGNNSQNVFAIHARLSSHLGKILDVIYGVHDHRDKNFIVEVQSILSRLAETSVVLKEHLNLDIEQLNDPLSRDAATLHLLLHQCVILTVKPVLFSLLAPVLSSESNDRHSTSPLDSLLRMCVESAINVLNIMFTLKNHTICDVFLPYDIDALFSASFALVLIDIIRPANGLLWDLPQVMGLLEEFVSRNVAPAKAYRSDLIQLVELHRKIRGVDFATDKTVSRFADPATQCDVAAYTFPPAGPIIVSPDPVWSRVRESDSGLVVMDTETIMSAINDLNVEGTDLFNLMMPDEGWRWDIDKL